MSAINLQIEDDLFKKQPKSLQATCCWPRLWSVLLLVIALTLLPVSLFGEKGVFIASSEKVVGLHKQCIKNQTTGELECFNYQSMKMNINNKGIVSSKCLIYATLVFCLFALLSFALDIWIQDGSDRSTWKCGFYLVVIAAALLFAGLVTFLLFAAEHIHFADFGLAFWMCLVAEAYLTICTLVSWHACREQNQYSIAVVI